MRILSLAITLFFVLDPFGNLPVVLGLLSRFEPQRRRFIMVRESLLALITMIIFYAVGPWFLKILEIGSSDLQIGGGVVLGIIAMRMVFPDQRHTIIRDIDSEPFIVPLAIPLISGPSALATVMIIAAQSTAQPLIGLGVISLAWFITSLLLLAGVILGSVIPSRILIALERLSGLLLAVIAVHMLMTGIQTYFLIK